MEDFVKKLIFTVILLGSFVRAYANSPSMVESSNCPYSSGAKRTENTIVHPKVAVASLMNGHAESYQQHFSNLNSKNSGPGIQ